jgi:hypothetical protein
MVIRTRKGKRRNRKEGSRDARGSVRGRIRGKINRINRINRKNTRCAKPYLYSRCLQDHIFWLIGNNKRRRIRTSNKERELLSP